jgi:hypothetical protein
MALRVRSRSRIRRTGGQPGSRIVGRFPGFVRLQIVLHQHQAGGDQRCVVDLPHDGKDIRQQVKRIENVEQRECDGANDANRDLAVGPRRGPPIWNFPWICSDLATTLAISVSETVLAPESIRRFSKSLSLMLDLPGNSDQAGTSPTNAPAPADDRLHPYRLMNLSIRCRASSIFS